MHLASKRISRFSKMHFLFLVLLFANFSFADKVFFDSLLAYANEKAGSAKFAISLRSVKTDSLIYSYNGNDWFVPASTQKLLVTAAALENIPLDYAPKTLVHLEGIKNSNIFSGILRIEGRGDPNVSARFYPNAFFVLNNLTNSIKSMGIDTVRGFLDLDTSFFRGPRKPEEWRKKFFDSWYGAEISPLSFNDNCALFEIIPGAKDGDSAQIRITPDIGYVKVKNDIKTGGKRVKYRYAMNPVNPEVSFSGTIGARAQVATLVLPIRNPAEYFKAAFLKSLEDSGIIFMEEKNVYRGIAIDSVAFSGPPLKSILAEINQRSQNLHAEILLRTLGQYHMQEGSAESGIISKKIFLRKAGIPEEDFKIMDGSGLSPKNSLKPNSITKLLTYMKRHEKGDIYFSSFAIPNVSGARKRLAEIEHRDKVRFKTGFIEGVHGLAGYISADNDTMAFALYFNNAQRVNENLARDILDTLAGRIAVKYNSSETASLEEGRILWQSGKEITDINQRINYFSNKLKGKPYFLGPMGEGISIYPSYKPRVNFKEMDCVTYMEHALALAYSKNYDDFFNTLQSIRYKNGIVDYKMRNHFLIADWVENNKFKIKSCNMQNFSILEMSAEFNSILKINNVELGFSKCIAGEFDIFEKTIDKKKFFNDLSVENPDINVPFLAKDKAIIFADTVKFERDTIFGVAILSELPGLDAAHTGFVVASQGKPLMLRHASQLKKQVIEQPLSEFLKTTKIKTPGISFFNLEKHEHGI